MSIIKDTFFGGAEKKAAKATQEGIERGITATKKATDKAELQLHKLFPAAQQNLQQGFQGALDVFGQSLPSQVQAFQQGNVGAQQQLLAGLQQQQNALFGNQVDFSQLQPVQAQADVGFAQQQLPQFVDPFSLEAQQAQQASFISPERQQQATLAGFANPRQQSMGGRSPSAPRPSGAELARLLSGTNF